MLSAREVTKLKELITEEYSNISGIAVYQIMGDADRRWEAYFGGSDANTRIHVASVTKSVLSALVGIAIDKGFIASTQEKVLSFFPDYKPSSANQSREEVTLGHMLDMTAPYPFPSGQDPFEQLCMSTDWADFILGQLGNGSALGDFTYSTISAHLLSVILTNATGKNAREFANQYLLEPLELSAISDYPMEGYDFDHLFGSKMRGWVQDPNGNSTGGWGLMLTIGELLRIGQLYLNHGVWNGRQILSQEWISRTMAANANHYSTLWWQLAADHITAYAAMGDGGNMICCIPQEHMVIAISSTFMLHPRDRWQLVTEHILPVFRVRAEPGDV